MSYRDELRRQLRLDEGVRRLPYRDSVGVLSIGVGRNLDVDGLRPDEISYLLENDMAQAEHDCCVLVPGFEALADARKAALCNMAFNLGATGLAEFVHMLRAINAGRWEDAAVAMLDSVWATQVGARAPRLAWMMRTGSFDAE